MAGHDTRRSALVRIVIGGLGLITGALAGLSGLVVAPPRGETGKRWRRAAPLAQLSDDKPMTAVLAERRAQGWYQTKKQSVVFIDRDGDGYRALSSTCAHLGCRVRWDDAKAQFLCPCHGGVYDRQGNVVAGPPPRPLDRLAVRVNPKTSELEIEL